MSGNFGLIDLDTPQDAYTFTSLSTGREMKLIFSDEFNTDGRSFYPGDDVCPGFLSIAIPVLICQ